MSPSDKPGAPEGPVQGEGFEMREAVSAKDGDAVPPMDFTTFVFSLGSSALIHLGETAHPESGKLERDLVLARQTIDILAMLKEKTRGNLSAQEDGFLDSLLYDLRMRFLAASKK